ncbi:RDD family protein [Pseudolysobacter antarcticus]|uniref:RDD family protein n=1 Tax=Pseudolysobacter antarcticus TaxID=2511995 RepID=A0A411HNH0_9GAMM|nr:RDD family protein [Pseudolysobacter antarcticus]QBB72012.1 RDD family protein [Pseudolysobacter antarcticus]
MQDQDLEYVGFWPRVGASILDTIILMLITGPLLIAIYGWSYFTAQSKSLIAGPADFLISWVFPAIAVILFWSYRQATPGKMVIAARVVDAETGRSLSIAQSIGRYLAYFVAMLPLFLGVIWIAFDPKKQGWHDKLAGTVVVRSRHRGPEPVRFRGANN